MSVRVRRGLVGVLVAGDAACGGEGLSASERLMVLTAELARIDSERHSTTTMFASLLGVVALLAGGFLALNGPTDTDPSPDWLWAAVAVLPLVLLAFVVTVFAREVVYSYHCREIERQLATFDAGVGLSGLPPAALETITTATAGNRRGLRELRTIYAAAYLIVSGVIFTGAVTALFKVQGLALRAAVAAAMVVVLFPSVRLSYLTTFKGRQTWERVSGEAVRELTQDLAPPAPRTGRRLIGYLLLPRPNELIVKGVMLHLTSALLGAALVAGDGVPWSRTLRAAAVSFVSFEVLMYQARYMWNDWNGKDLDDPQHARALGRGRMPEVGSRPRRWAVWVTVVGRGVAAVALLGLLPWDLAVPLAGGLAACWALAVVYERLRSVQVPPTSGRFHRSTAALFAVVGSSYAIRAGLGVYLGSEAGLGLVAVALIGAAFYFSGSSTVLMAWLLESTEYVGTLTASRVSTGRLVASRSAVLDTIGTKWHLVALAWEADRIDTAPLAAPSSRVTLPDVDQRILQRLGRWRLSWNMAFVVAVAFAAEAGLVVAVPSSTVGARTVVAVVALAGGVAIVSYPAVAIAVGVAAALWAVGALQLRDGPLWFALVPAAAVALTYATTRGFRYADTIDLPGRARQALGQARRTVTWALREIVR